MTGQTHETLLLQALDKGGPLSGPDCAELRSDIRTGRREWALPLLRKMEVRGLVRAVDPPGKRAAGQRFEITEAGRQAITQGMEGSE